MANTSFTSRLLSTLVIFTVALGFGACGITVKEKDSGHGNKDVTIQSPVGDLHVGKDVRAADTGLTVYPGAKLVEKDDGGSDRANVNISTALFGLKLAVVKYVSDDAPEKLVAFYANDLRRYGTVLECRKSGSGAEWHVGTDSHDKAKNDKAKDDKEKNDKPKRAHELTCRGDNKGETVEIRVGTENNQHIVAISPKGKGSEFALVYVHAREDSTI